MGERAKHARQYTLAQAPKVEAVPTPFWPELNGFVYFQDVPSDLITQVTDESKGMDGQPDATKAGAGMICLALVVREDDGTYCPIYTYPDDRDTVAHLGLSLLLPVMNQANAFFGLTPDAVQQAKNGSGTIQPNFSGTASHIVKEAVIVP